MNIPELTTENLRILLSVAAAVIVLACLAWPRNALGRAKRPGALTGVAAVLGILTGASSMVLAWQGERVTAAELGHLRDSSTQMRAQLTAITSELSAATSEVESLRRTASEERKVSAAKQAALESQLASIATTATTVGRTLQLQFTDDKVTFETGKKELTCGTKENLARIVGYLSRDIAGIEKITIIGHTDFTGSPQFNEGLAIARANEVREYLQASGIPGEMLAEPEGHSFRRPFGYATDQSDEVIRHSNETAAQKAKNRRVQMNVLNLKAP